MNQTKSRTRTNRKPDASKCCILTDTKNSGTYDLIETDTTNIDGSRRVIAMESGGSSGQRRALRRDPLAHAHGLEVVDETLQPHGDEIVGLAGAI